MRHETGCKLLHPADTLMRLYNTYEFNPSGTWPTIPSTNINASCMQYTSRYISSIYHTLRNSITSVTTSYFWNKFTYRNFSRLQKCAAGLGTSLPAIYLGRRGVDLRSNPLQCSKSKSNAPYLNRNNSYIYRLVHHFGSNWRECSRRSK